MRLVVVMVWVVMVRMMRGDMRGEIVVGVHRVMVWVEMMLMGWRHIRILMGRRGAVLRMA
jgi:hypothetical protein